MPPDILIDDTTIDKINIKQDTDYTTTGGILIQ